VKCLKKETIMHYLDNEMDDNKRENVEKHLALCESCHSAVKNIRDEIEFVKSNLNILNPAEITIPSFEDSLLYDKKEGRAATVFSLRRDKSLRLIKRVVIPLAAVLALTIIGLNYTDVFNKRLDASQIEAILKAEEEMFVPESNSWWTERRLVITIIDEDKKTCERIITSNKEENIISETFSY